VLFSFAPERAVCFVARPDAAAASAP